MKKIFIILALLTCAFGNEAFAISKTKSSKQTESLNYDVYYHWGIIWMKAGRGTLGLYDETAVDGMKRMHGKLVGRTLSIAEKIMTVRDTLETWYSPAYVPIEFVKKTNEGSYKAIERNFYTPTLIKGDTLTPANVKSTDVKIERWRNKNGNDAKNLSTSGVAHDMLSAFYMVRGLDFDNMKPGTVVEFPVFAGIKKQTMRVKYVGLSKTKLRSGKKYDAHKVEMSINTKGEDGAPLDLWLSTDPDHRPVNVIIQLRRIGAIQCEIVE